MNLLILLGKHPHLNLYQFEVLISYLGPKNFGPSIIYLQKEGLVKKCEHLPRKGENDFTFSYDTNFEITLTGIQFLENRKDEKRKFRLKSLYIPIFISFITSLVTTLTAMLLARP